MPKFVFAYHGGPKSMSKEEGAAHMTRWKAWTESLGPALVDPGMAVGASKTVSPSGVADNGGSNPISGVSVVEANDINGAVKMAKVCPHLAIGGSIEIAPVLDMAM
jgi:hypothetical protein